MVERGSHKPRVGSSTLPTAIGVATMWNLERIKEQETEIQAVRQHVVISGGVAWHLMSPPHQEKKQLHDHKDVDLFVEPDKFAHVIALLKERGFEKTWTKYDDKSGDFYRYTKYCENGKVMLDLFVQHVPSIEVKGFRVVEPVYLLSLYESTHSSKECLAVQAAMKLIGSDVSPVGRSELVGEYALE